jgi:cytochrome c oxidase subunit 2
LASTALGPEVGTVIMQPALGPRRRIDRRLLTVALVLGVLCIGLLAPAGALADIFTPESGGGSPQAELTDTLYKVTLFMAIPIFLLVEGVLIFSLLNHRFRRGAGAPAQVRGNTRLEIGWTIGAAVILVILTAVTFAMLPGIRDPERSGPEQAGALQFAATGQPAVPGGQGLNIKVVGQQYLWRYDYPGPGRLSAYHTMVVPTNTTVTLDITSADVQHSFWIPELFGKADAVPGHINDMWFKVTEEGTYRGNCAELCGENHSQMIGAVKAVSPEAFRAWVARQRADLDASTRALVEQRRRFESGTPGGGTANSPPR